MKNLFKKSTKKEKTVCIQKLDKTQLEKVIGGIDNASTSRTGSKGGKITFGGGTTSPE
jgi:hypothetical protein